MRRALAAAALLLAACGDESPTGPITPQCNNPAPIIGTSSRPNAVVDDYVILLEPGFDVRAESARLATKHGFVVTEIFTIIPAFSAPLNVEMATRLRCEPSVTSLSYVHTNVPPPH